MFQRSGRYLVGWRRWAAALLTLILLVTTGVVTSRATATLQPDTGFTPANGYSQVIAQGVIVLSGEAAVWRTVRYSAMPDAAAEFGAWPLGFVLATTAPLLLTDQETGHQVRLGPGEAALVRDDTRQRRASLDDAVASYLALELVLAAQADESDVGTILGTWPVDRAAPGPRDIDLVRSVLIGGETALLPGTGETNLLFVTEGNLLAGPPGEAGRNLLAGEALTFTGDLEARQAAVSDDDDSAARARGVFVAAIIGPVVPASSTLETGEETIERPAGPIRSAPIGSMSVQVLNCPAGLDTDNPDPGQCTAAAGDFDFILSSDAFSMTLTIADSVSTGNVSTWEGLPLGTYRLVGVVLPAGSDTYVVTADVPIEGGPEIGYTITLDETTPDVMVRVYNIRAS